MIARLRRRSKSISHTPGRQRFPYRRGAVVVLIRQWMPNMDDRVKDFLTYDYGEAKDLAKSFLTLVSAILVGTITFSEKIINFQTASAGQRRLTIASWSFFVLSMIICGIGLCFLFSSASMAVDCGYNNCTINYPFVGDILTPPPASG